MRSQIRIGVHDGVLQVCGVTICVPRLCQGAWEWWTLTYPTGDPLEIRPENLRKHYASLSDEALLAIDRGGLTENAQTCYDEELAERGLFPGADDVPLVDGGPQPEWLEDAFCVCSFAASPGVYAAPDAAKACEALEAAGIPCHISAHEIHDPQNAAAPRREFRVMVPGGFNLEATSILDQKLFNPEIEADWKTHFQELSDEEFQAVNPESICAGLLDRANRLRKAYDEEAARRRTAE